MGDCQSKPKDVVEKKDRTTQNISSNSVSVNSSPSAVPFINKIIGLSDNKQKENHACDLEERSITPRTHKERDFGASELNGLINSDATRGDYYIDKYEHKDSSDAVIHKVLRFGINHYQDNLHRILTNFNTITAAKLNSADKLDKLSRTDQGSNNNTSEAIQEMQELKNANQLTDTEKKLTTEAISYLNSNSNSNTVLLDIFARNSQDGEIKFKDKSDVPEIHTVVLYKQQSSSGLNDFLVIDPSNAMFSRVLAGANDHIRLCLAKKFQVYSKCRNGVTSSKLDEWRDCVDIAVKLSFHLNKNQDEIALTEWTDGTNSCKVINYKSLVNSWSVKEVTNNVGMYGKLPSQIEEETVRSKQSSDVQQNKYITCYLKVLKEQKERIDDKLQERIDEKPPYKLGDFYHVKHKLLNVKNACVTIFTDAIKKKLEYIGDSRALEPDHSKYKDSLIETLGKLDKVLAHIDDKDYILSQELSLIGEGELTIFN